MIITGSVFAIQQLNGTWRLEDDSKVELLQTKYSGLAFILEELLNDRGSELDLETGWVLPEVGERGNK